MEGAQLQGYLTLAGFLLIILGVVLVFLGVFASIMSGAGKVEAGGVVMIGPIPVIFGTSAKAALIAALLAIIMMIVYIVVVLLMVKRLV